MNLIDKSYFTKELHIGDLSNTRDGSPDMLNLYIERYQKEYLTILLGNDLYNEFMAGLELEPVPQEWTDLLNEIVDSTLKVSPIANYVYYFWQQQNYTKNVGIGQVKNKAENSIVVRPYDQQVYAWNEMVKMSDKVFKYIEQPIYIYSHCGCRWVRKFPFKNTLNL